MPSRGHWRLSVLSPEGWKKFHPGRGKMIKEDFIIQTEVRRMLIRANIDYSKIDLGTVRGVVYLRGLFYLSRIPVGDEGRAKEFIAKTLYALEKKARSISGGRVVVFKF